MTPGLIPSGDTSRLQQRLNELPTEDALLVLEAYENKRKQEHYAKYWSSDPDPRCARFFDSIEEDFSKFTKDIKVYGLLGGNRSSKTERGAFLVVAWLLGKDYFRDEPSWRYVRDLPIPEHGVNIWAVGLDFSVIRDVIWNEKLRRGHQHPGLLPDSTCPYITRISDSTFQVEVDVNGRKSTLTCKSADSGREKFQSASIDLAWIDEECDEEVYNEIYQRTVDCAGKVLLTLTPLLDIASGVRRPWVYDLYKEWKHGSKEAVFIQLSALDNPFIPDAEKERLKAKWAGHPEERARLYGEFIQRSGLIYPEFDRAKHVVKPFRIPGEWRRVAAIDPAATGVTACVWAAVSPRNDIYVYRLYYEKDRIVSDHAKDILVRTSGDKVDLWVIDAFWGAARNAETHRQGYQLYRDAGIPVRLGPREADYALQVLREYIHATVEPTARHPKIYFFEGACETLLWELEGYVWDSYAKGSQKGATKEKPMKRNDHAINALQYLVALHPKSRFGGPVEHDPNNSYT